MDFADSVPVTRELLLRWFETGIPRAESIGLEIEYGLVRPATCLPIGYQERHGQAELLRTIAQTLGGQPLFDGAALIGVVLPDGAKVSLEAGSALEYSGMPSASLTDALAAARTAQLRLAELARPLDIALLSGGCLPFGDGNPVEWVPKPRTPLMMSHFQRLGQAGRCAAQVMGRSLSTQVTLDATSVAEYLDKLHTLLCVSPYIAALLVNSPDLARSDQPRSSTAGSAASTRMRHWRQIDPARCQQLTRRLLTITDVAELVDVLIRIPMIFSSSPSGPVPAPAENFAELIDLGGPGAPRLSDWVSHLSQVWPDVRPRQTLETRLPDGQSWSQLEVLPALWLGLTGDAKTRRRAVEVTAASSSSAAQVTVQAAEGFGHLHPMDREICRELVTLSGRGLAARVERGLESAELLLAVEVVAEIADSGWTPADRLRSLWNTQWRREPAAYVQAMSVRPT